MAKKIFLRLIGSILLPVLSWPTPAAASSTHLSPDLRLNDAVFRRAFSAGEDGPILDRESRNPAEKPDWFPVGWSEYLARVLTSFAHPALPQVKLINGQTHTLWLEGPNMEEWAYRSLQMSDAAFIRQVIEWTLQVSEAAVMLNAAGIEHGDIQPGNVVIWRNRYPVLKDFEDECFFDRQGIGHLISVAITARELVRASQGGMATFPAALMLDAMHQRYDRELLSIAQAEYASVLEFNEALRAYYRREYRKDFATPGFDQIKPALLQMNQLRAELYRARIIEGSI